jgi:3-dehydroshikimate dehydratase
VGRLVHRSARGILPGLVSVTFRRLSPEEVIELVVQTALRGIEWGGDVHVPPGDVAGARRVLAMTKKANLRTSAYGSYYRVGESEAEGLAFEQVLRTAVELEAPTVRVWAGSRGSADADERHRERVVRDARWIAALAAGAGISISFEFHEGTLADDAEAMLRLLADLDHPNACSFWQPPVGAGAGECVEGLKRLLPRLANVHAFHWSPEGLRLPLSEGADRWSRYLRALAGSGSRHWASVEFVRDDDPQQFLADAATLVGWVESANAGY